MPPLSWMPRAVLHFLRIYPYFFDIYLCIFSENSLVGFPQLDARGRRTAPDPPSARHWLKHCAVLSNLRCRNHPPQNTYHVGLQRCVHHHPHLVAPAVISFTDMQSPRIHKNVHK